MGSLKFPHASGNSMAIAAPATNPASDLELKLPATIGTANQYLKNSGTPGTLEFGSITTGKILQVVQTVKTDTATRAASGFADIPGMSVTIRPASGTKILVHYSIQTSHTNGARFAHTKLVRDSTDIAIGDEVTSRTRATTGVGTPAGNGDYMLQNQTMVFLDTHGADGSTDVVYKLQWWIDDRTSQSTIYLNRTLADMGNAAAMRGVSTITAVEVAA